MGTRSNTIVIDETTPILNMYRQMDGYVSGHGAELAEFLAPMQICNGFGQDQDMGTWANGAGCLAAQIVKHFKDGIGHIYLVQPVKTASEEYGYILTIKDQAVRVKVTNGKTLFDGPAAGFVLWARTDGQDL